MAAETYHYRRPDFESTSCVECKEHHGKAKIERERRLVALRRVGRFSELVRRPFENDDGSTKP